MPTVSSQHERAATTDADSLQLGAPQEPAEAHNRYAWLLGLAILIGAALRIGTAGVQSYWLDETVTLNLLHRGFFDMLSALPHSESTPPLYYVLAWPWAHVFGYSEAGVRSLSALFSVATIPVVYAIGKQLASRRVGLVAAWLFALNPMTFYYGQEARAYSLLVLFSALSMLYFTRALERPEKAPLVGWAVASALALCSHYFAIFLVAPELVWLLWRYRSSHAVRWASAAVVLATLAVAPLALAQRSTGNANWIGSTALSEWVAQVPKQFLVGLDGPHEAITGALSLLLVGVGLLILWRRGDERELNAARVGAILGIATIAIPLVLSLGGVHVFNGRNVIAAWVPISVVVAAGLGSRRGGSLALGAAGAVAIVWLAVLGLVVTDKAYQRDDWRDALHAAQSGSGTRALALNADKDSFYPVGVYLPAASQMRGPGKAVDEIDVVQLADRESGHALVAPKLPTAPPPPGFTRVSAKRAKTYTIVRYRATRPVQMDAGQVATAIGNRRATVFLLKPSA